MKPFSKSEIIGVFLILVVVIIVTSINLKSSLRRARDAQRRADIGAVANVLGSIQKDFGFFPGSSDGRIVFCKAENFGEVVSQIEEGELTQDDLLNGLRSCEWGKDGLSDLGVFETDERTYISKLPQDPKSDEGFSYNYLSDSKRFQLYAYLEGGNSEDGYNEGIVARHLMCGNKVCNFGKSYGGAPLDISIEDYEQNLLEK
jgi:hypothetical protein